MRHLWSLKQLFSVYMLLFIEEVFLQKKKKKKKKKKKISWKKENS